MKSELFLDIADRYLPGIFFFRRKRIADGLWRLLSIALPLFIFVASLARVRGGFLSFCYAAELFFSGSSVFPNLFQTEILSFWVAVFILILWIVMAVIVHRRAIQKALIPALESKPFSFIRAIHERASSRWAFRFISGWGLAALLTPLLAPENPVMQSELSVTRLKPPLSKMYFVNDHQDELSADTILQDSERAFVRIQQRLIYPTQHDLYADEIKIQNDTLILRQGKMFKRITLRAFERTDYSIGYRINWLGRDIYGRDVLSRLLYGARISFTVSLIAVTLAVALGILIGAAAGYAGGFTDSLLMRLTDVMLAFPVIFLVLLMTGFWGSSPLTLTLLIGLSGWMGIARLVRSEVMAIKEKEYVLAARASGFHPWRILFRHILPNALTPVIVSATLRIGTVMMIEAGLSFLGLGIQPPTPSWGNMILEGRAYLSDAWWISLFPALALISCVISINILGDTLRDSMDPRSATRPSLPDNNG